MIFIYYLHSSRFSICIVTSTIHLTVVSMLQTSTILVKKTSTADWKSFESFKTLASIVVIITNDPFLTNFIFIGISLNLSSHLVRICSTSAAFQCSGVASCHNTRHSSPPILYYYIYNRMLKIYSKYKSSIFLLRKDSMCFGFIYMYV